MIDRKLLSGRLHKKILPYLLMLPGLILIVVLLLYPLGRGIVSSFFREKMGAAEPAQFVGLQNYIALFKDDIFVRAFFNTILWTIFVVSFQFIGGLIIALMLNENFRGRAIYRSLVLIPWVIPNIAAGLTWKWIYSYQYGIFNYFFEWIGWLKEPIDWLGQPRYALLSVIITAIWKGLPFITIVLLAALQGIPYELYEAAAISGANVLQRFRYVTLPSLKQVGTMAVLLEIIWTFNQFDLVYVMTKGGPANSSQLVPLYSYLTAFNFFDMNYAAAIGVVGLLMMSVFVVIYLRKQ